MRRTALLLGMAGLVWLSAAPLAAQGVTGPSKDVKSVGAGDPAAGLDWASWTADEAVDLLVHQPVKRIGLAGMQAERQLALKALVTRTEARVREVFAALHTGSVSRGTARADLDAILGEYAQGLEERTPR